MNPIQTKTETRVAGDVVLDLAGKRLLIEGHEFPFLIVEDGVTVEPCFEDEALGLQLVTVTFFAENVRTIPAGA